MPYNLDKEIYSTKKKKYKNNKRRNIRSIYYLIKYSSLLWISNNFKQKLNQKYLLGQKKISFLKFKSKRKNFEWIFQHFYQIIHPDVYIFYIHSRLNIFANYLIRLKKTFISYLILELLLNSCDILEITTNIMRIDIKIGIIFNIFIRLNYFLLSFYVELLSFSFFIEADPLNLNFFS